MLLRKPKWFELGMFPICSAIAIQLQHPQANKKYVEIREIKDYNVPVSPFVTTLQLTTLGSTALRSSRKKIPFERFLS